MTSLWQDHFWTIAAIASAIFGAFCMFADHRRFKRQNLEKVGFMPWTGLSIFATLVTVFAAALAIKSG
jgi:hypothetical protein